MRKFKEVKPTVSVEIIESERGWGQKVDEVKTFEDCATAEAFVREYNSKNTATETPDWYMYARIV